MPLKKRVPQSGNLIRLFYLIMVFHVPDSAVIFIVFNQISIYFVTTYFSINVVNLFPINYTFHLKRVDFSPR